MASSGRTYEYINDFLFFVIRPEEGRGSGVLSYCSGVNLERFLPVTRRRHGLGSNPALRGVQIVKCGVRDIALAKGATPRAERGLNCSGIAPTKDTWFSESLLIENAPVSLPDEIMAFCVLDLLRSIFKACMLEVELPEKAPAPGELQVLLEGAVAKYGREAGTVR